MHALPDQSHVFPAYAAAGAFDPNIYLSSDFSNELLSPSASSPSHLVVGSMSHQRMPLKRSWQVSELGHDHAFSQGHLQHTAQNSTAHDMLKTGPLQHTPYLWGQACLCDYPECDDACDDGCNGEDVYNCNDPATACYDASCVSSACPQCPDVCEAGEIAFPCENEGCQDEPCHLDIGHGHDHGPISSCDEPELKRARVLQYLADSTAAAAWPEDAFASFDSTHPQSFDQHFADAQSSSLMGFPHIPLSFDDNQLSLTSLHMPLDYSHTPAGISDSIETATPSLLPDLSDPIVQPAEVVSAHAVELSQQPLTSKESSVLSTDTPQRCEWVCENGVPCNALFDGPNSLHKHVSEHHLKWLNKSTTYKCRWETCDRHEQCLKNGKDGDFKQRSKLERHMQTHTGYKACTCTICGEQLASKQSLDNHMRTHTKERPFACTWPGCGKTFAVATALHTHKRTHTGERPLICNECGRSFPDSSNLSSHKANVHKSKAAGIFMCTHLGCGKSFNKRPQLEAHMKRHIKQEAVDS